MTIPVLGHFDDAIAVSVNEIGGTRRGQANQFARPPGS
jgi:hypothetical protein